MNGILKKIQSKYVLFGGIILTILALAYQEFLTHIELGIHDEPWHIANCWSPKDYPMTFLPYLIGNWFGSMFGYSLLVFRHIALSINILSIAIVMLPLIIKRRFKTAFCLSGLLLWGILFPNLWGYDCMSNLFLSLVLLCYYYFYSSNGRSIFLLIAMGATIALFSLSRFPNILIFPCLISYLIINGIIEKDGWKRIVKYLFILSSSFLLVYSIIILLYYESFSEFISHILSGSMSEASSTHHNIKGLIISYFYWALPRILLATIFIITLSYAFNITIKSVEKKRYNQYISLTVGSICIIFITYTYLWIVNDQFNSGAFWFRNGILLFMALFSIIRLYKHPHFYSWTTFAIFMLFIAAIPAAGSNTGLSKVASILVIPLLINFFNWRKDKLFLIFIASLLFGQILHTLYFNSEHGFENKGWKYNTRKITYDKIDVYTLPTIKESFEALAKEYQKDKNCNKSVLFIGDQRFLYNYIANVKVSATLHTFYEDINSIKYQQAIVEHINQYQCDNIYVVNEYNKLKDITEEHSAYHSTADSLLQANGYRFERYIANTGYKKYAKTKNALIEF